jgi:hypothetical protein
MDRENIFPMSAVEHDLPRDRRRGQRSPRSAQAPHPSGRRGGRAWINGREVGGTQARYAHLAVSHD